jgi:hypothetical protein
MHGLRPAAVFTDLFGELQARCARKLHPGGGAADTQVTSPYRRALLRDTGSVLERSLATLEHQPYDHFALASAIKLVEAREPGAEILGELYARACLVAPEDVPPERRPAELAPFLPS